MQAQCSTNIDAEASQERLPEGVFLDSLLIQAISQEFKAQVLLEAAVATPELPVLKSRAQVLLLIGGDTLKQHRLVFAGFNSCSPCIDHLS